MAHPGGQKFYIGKHAKIFLSETTRPSVLAFGMKHHLVDLYQVCSNYTPGAKHGPAPGGHMLSIGLHRENMNNLLV